MDKPKKTPPLGPRLLAEAIGSAFLLIGIVGSGIMASDLSPNDVGLQLLENAAATTGVLIGIIIMFATVSGAHFNPVVTLVDRGLGLISTKDTVAYILAQFAGGCIGTILANAMFMDTTNKGLVFISARERCSGPLWISEIISTVGLLLIIHGAIRYGKPYVVAVAVGVWIGGAYFFTSSTSFANPMVSVARTLSDTFAGIEPVSAAWFIVMQLIGATIGFFLIRYLFPREE